jgi:galactokinase
MADARSDASSIFHSRFGAWPEQSCSAPGRVNLIGEHTDYNFGFVLPLTIDRRCYAAGDLRGDPGVVEVISRETQECVRFRIGDDAMRKSGWAAYVAGVIAQFHAIGRIQHGIRIAIASDVPSGAGLSSSAALEVSVGRLVCELVGFEFESMSMAKLCMRAEHEYAGVPCGLMDQAIVSGGREGFAMLMDCRDESCEHIALPREFDLLVIDSGVKHAHGQGEYRTRAEECARAAAALGVRSLRECERYEEAKRLPLTLFRRVKHVVEENRRVLRAVELLKSADVAELGHVLTMSHLSLRDEYEVSCSEVDDLVARVLGVEGVYGARMTGGGFGGCVAVLGKSDALDELWEVERMRAGVSSGAAAIRVRGR